MYYFYLNFPEFKSKEIMIHDQNCGHCNSGQGKHGTLSNENGFWAGPFNKITDVELALNELSKIVEYKFKFRRCSSCLKHFKS